MILDTIKYFEIQSFYWLMNKGISLDDIHSKASNHKYIKELSQLSKGYFATNSIYPQVSTQRVLDFIMEYHNEK